MAKVRRFSEEKRAHSKTTVLVTAAALVSASALFVGCSYFQDKYFPTTVYETETTTTATGIQLSVDPDATVSPESIGETVNSTTTESTDPDVTVSSESIGETVNSTTTESGIPSFEGAFYRQIPEVPSELTLDSFASIPKDKKLEDLEAEFGPYARKDGNLYVWILSDGSEVWVHFFDFVRTDPETGEQIEDEPIYTVRFAIHIDGIDQTVLFAYDDLNLYRGEDYLGYTITTLETREFGPELERGWYILEKDGAYYIIISAGKREVRDSGIWIYRCRVDKFDNGGQLLTLEIDTVYYEEERPELDRCPYPCCGIKIDRLPPDILVMEHGSSKRIPFKGCFVLEEE